MSCIDRIPNINRSSIDTFRSISNSFGSSSSQLQTTQGSSCMDMFQKFHFSPKRIREDTIPKISGFLRSVHYESPRGSWIFPHYTNCFVLFPTIKVLDNTPDRNTSDRSVILFPCHLPTMFKLIQQHRSPACMSLVEIALKRNLIGQASNNMSIVVS